MLAQVQLVKIISKGEIFHIRSDMPNELKPIYNILGIKKSKAFMHSSNL